MEKDINEKVEVTISLHKEIVNALESAEIATGNDKSKIVEDLLRKDKNVKRYIDAMREEGKVGGVFAVRRNK